jgi:hypothetical protein
MICIALLFMARHDQAWHRVGLDIRYDGPMIWIFKACVLSTWRISYVEYDKVSGRGIC